MTSKPLADAVLAHEALALALDGRPDDGLELLDRVLGMPAGRPTDHPELLLARARIVRASAGRSEGAETVVGVGDWRGHLDRVRAARKAGGFDLAAQHLQSALQAFRTAMEEGSDGGTGTQREAVETMLVREAEILTRAPGSDRSAADPAPRAFSRQSLLDLIDLGRRLASETEPTELLRIVLHEALRMTGTTRGFIVRSSGSELEFAVAENIDRSIVEEPALEVSRTLIRQVQDTGSREIVALPRLPHGHPATRSLEGLGVQDVLCVPLIRGDRVLGVLYLDALATDRVEPAGTDAEPGAVSSVRHSGETLALLELLAAQAVTALENAESRSSLARALETAEESLQRHRRGSLRRTRYDTLVGASEPMQQVYRHIDLIAPTEESVLILGETGTGKDLLARVIHARGPRADREFLAVNCATLSESLLESELFGHERGAFTGADRSRPGLFEMAHGGTLFLDEVGDMSPRMQAELLQVLQTGEVRRVGARRTTVVSVRTIAATHRDLEERVQRGEFRQDLFYRLNVLPVRLPALRERSDDIPLLVQALIPRLAGDRPAPVWTSEALARLQVHSWPGNVRELENLLRRVLASGRRRIRVTDLPEEVRRSVEEPQTGTLRAAERRAIHQALRRTAGNKTKAARLLGINRATLYAKLKQLS